MTNVIPLSEVRSPVHTWLRQISFAHVPGPATPLLQSAAENLMDQLHRQGHRSEAVPNDKTDVIITTASFGEPLGWRDAMLFTARRRWRLSRTPTIYTLIHACPAELQTLLDHFDGVLHKDPPDPADYDFPGLAPTAFETLVEQGKRGGPIMAVERLLQAQSKGIRIILIVGHDQPQHAYYFDLVGAHRCIEADDPDYFYDDMAVRLVTSVSTSQVTRHSVTGEPIPRQVWDGLTTPEAMRVAGRQLGKRRFFTEMVRIADLVQVPAVADAVALQYSEGCFATWDPDLGALITTVTGSARPVEKENITDDELAVIVGVSPGGRGAVVRHVEQKRNDPPSSEAVEMMDMDSVLPKLALDPSRGSTASVPVIRSKLHGHRGVGAFDSRHVEFVALDAPYYHYPVSCATEAQARAIRAAFSRSAALQNPADPRQVVFTVLPGHGIVIAEKWVAGMDPFQTMWEYMDAGYLQLENRIPQGPMEYVEGAGGLFEVRDLVNCEV